MSTRSPHTGCRGWSRGGRQHYGHISAVLYVGKGKGTQIKIKINEKEPAPNQHKSVNHSKGERPGQSAPSTGEGLLPAPSAAGPWLLCYLLRLSQKDFINDLGFSFLPFPSVPPPLFLRRFLIFPVCAE